MEYKNMYTTYKRWKKKIKNNVKRQNSCLSSLLNSPEPRKKTDVSFWKTLKTWNTEPKRQKKCLFGLANASCK